MSPRGYSTSSSPLPARRSRTPRQTWRSTRDSSPPRLARSADRRGLVVPRAGCDDPHRRPLALAAQAEEEERLGARPPAGTLRYGLARAARARRRRRAHLLARRRCRRAARLRPRALGVMALVARRPGPPGGSGGSRRRLAPAARAGRFG